MYHTPYTRYQTLAPDTRAPRRSTRTSRSYKPGRPGQFPKTAIWGEQRHPGRPGHAKLIFPSTISSQAAVSPAKPASSAQFSTQHFGKSQNRLRKKIAYTSRFQHIYIYIYIYIYVYAEIDKCTPFFFGAGFGFFQNAEVEKCALIFSGAVFCFCTEYG